MKFHLNVSPTNFSSYRNRVCKYLALYVRVKKSPRRLFFGSYIIQEIIETIYMSNSDQQSSRKKQNKYSLKINDL